MNFYLRSVSIVCSSAWFGIRFTRVQIPPLRPFCSRSKAKNYINLLNWNRRSFHFSREHPFEPQVAKWSIRGRLKISSVKSGEGSTPSLRTIYFILAWNMVISICASRINVVSIVRLAMSWKSMLTIIQNSLHFKNFIGVFNLTMTPILRLEIHQGKFFNIFSYAIP